ncbi:hypothetical protein IW261DRAFT_1497364 [Armillaria novae-zelandiae]|uniref:Uncharacterized protein n=1 Tax=Armillaria novae-zelandiae TaxID=153914 RepID=A0AA39P0N2_9AGAR|nr:hypothetical protein IW261DRAFT_1497364 [Armillaria novae-zelandiae]
MAAPTNIPPDLSDADRTSIFQNLDTNLNSRILYSLLTGFYTGVIAVTLWNIFTNKSRPIARAMVVVITLLYIVTIIDFALVWSNIPSIFVNHGQNFWTEIMFSNSPGVKTIISAGTVSAVGTVLADSTMIWRCWIVWGRQWVIIILPILFLLSSIAFKIVGEYQDFTILNNYTFNFVLYATFLLATTLWCTMLIIYRVITVSRAGGEAIGGGVRAYLRLIEVLVESSALYSICLMLYVGFYARDSWTGPYFDILAGSARGIAPTVLVGRVAAGHARPDDSWQGSAILASLRFSFGGPPTRDHDSTMSNDPEAQRERDNEPDIIRGDDLAAYQEDDQHTIGVV